MTHPARPERGAAPATPAPPREVAVERLRFDDDGATPNHPTLPALVLRGALPGAATEAVKALFEANRWFRVWDWTVFDFHHFHPDAHEVLAVTRGRARLRLGGAEGRDVEVAAGDALVLPAGTGHRREAAADGFTVVGAYPEGQEARTVRPSGGPVPPSVRHEIAGVPLPATDPLHGRDGPVIAAWRDAT